MAVIVLAMIGANAAEVWVPTWYQKLFDALVQNDFSKFDLMVKLIIGAGVAHMAAWLAWRIFHFTLSFFASRTMADLVNTCFKYLHDHSYNFFSNNFAGTLLKRVTRYERAYEIIIDKFTWDLGQTVFRFIFILAVLAFVNWIFALILFVWSIFYILFQIKFSLYKLKYDIARADLDSRLSGRLADTIANNVNLKLFAAEKQEYKSFQKLNRQLDKVRKWTWDLGGISDAIQALLMIGLELVVFYMALRFWRDGALTAGVFILIQTYLIQLFGRLWGLGYHIREIYEALADSEEMTNILITPHEIQDGPDAGELKVTKGEIKFQSVTFGYYKNKKSFRNFNLAIKAGEKIALIGPSGGGKSTIVKLLFRFHDIQGGKILIDGQNIAEVTQNSLRHNLSLVPQDPILFHRSLMENIRYGRPDVADEEVIKAAKLAHCHEFISGFPDGYETYVGERGVKLSGGERQRVAIARAILKDAPILVLDEATSSLDSESEYLIQDAMQTLMQGKTVIIIANRLSTIMQMDRIVVIEKGKIAEEGKHDELLKAKQGIYQKLWQIQAGGFAQ